MPKNKISFSSTTINNILNIIINYMIINILQKVPEDYPSVMCEFYNKNNIQLLRHGLDGNKWPFKEIDHPSLYHALIDILNPCNQPLLIHCNKGNI